MKKYLLISTTYILYVLLSVFMKPGMVAAASYPVGTLIKVANKADIYYVGSDSYKYKIPDEATFRSWYSDFSGVKNVSLADFNFYRTAKYNVTVEPVKQLVKFANSTKVYLVDAGATLRWISDEKTAQTYYGSDWYKNILILPSKDFNDYKFGSDLNISTKFSKTYAAALSTSIDAELRNRGIIASKVSTGMVAVVELEPLLRSLTENLSARLQPSFNTRTNNYFINAKFTETSFTLKPLATDTDLNVYVNGTPVATYASINLALSIGTNNYTIKVVNQNGTENVYTLEVLREGPNENNYIRSISENLRDKFTPGFKAETRKYDLVAQYDESILNLNILAEDTLTNIYVNDKKLSSGYKGTASISLNYGDNKVTIRSVSQNGATTYYEIAVKRYQYPKLGDNDLASLKTNFVGGFFPAFDSKHSIYFISADADVERFLVTAKAKNSKARVIIDGTQTTSKYVTLDYGENNIKVVVEIPDAPEFNKTYTLKVYRELE
ncbi:MAG: collagenolytic protease [uncultured bacterium]|nr:MAG: collagenolytic protease [uncultured bacterium]HAO52231.1 hypothetical protein [Candidatus Magasanikbacteria bacterium]